MKTCKKCGATKCLDEFYPHARCTDGTEGTCKECKIFAAVAHQTQHPEAHAISRDKWNKAHPQNLRAASDRWTDANPEKVRAAANRWNRAHPAQNNTRNSRHRAEKLRATPVWANNAVIADVYETAQDLTELTYREWHVDHVVPLRHKLVCGLHTEQNLRPLEGVENARKGNRHWPDMP